MKIKTLIVVSLLMTSLMSCQPYCRQYYIYLPHDNAIYDFLSDLEIYLYLRSHKYYITAFKSYKNPSSDIFYRWYVSGGTVHRKGHKYYLRDRDYGFEFVLEKRDSLFYIEKAFPGLTGKEFTYWRKLKYNDDCADETDSLSRSFLASIRNVVPNDSITYLLKHGSYEDDSLSTLCLHVNEDYSYEFYIYEFLVSRGIWSRENNLLTLKDESLDYTLQFDIGDGCLTSRALPWQWREKYILSYRENGVLSKQ